MRRGATLRPTVTPKSTTRCALCRMDSRELGPRWQRFVATRPPWRGTCCTPRMITLFRGGDVYAPERLGAADVLVVAGSIARVGHETADFGATRLPFVEIDARGCIVAPGFIDVHSH